MKHSWEYEENPDQRFDVSVEGCIIITVDVKMGSTNGHFSDSLPAFRKSITGR